MSKPQDWPNLEILPPVATMIEITDSAVSVFQQILLSGIDPYDLESDEGRMT
jgi:hypothetical protein